MTNLNTNDTPRYWHPEDVKAAIRKRGKSMADLAREHHLPSANVRNALRRPVRSGEIVIAAFLGIPLCELWPDRWDVNGKRVLRPRTVSQSPLREGNHGDGMDKGLA